jgi:hypothetical protein
MPQLKDKDIKFIFDEWGNRMRSAWREMAAEASCGKPEC